MAKKKKKAGASRTPRAKQTKKKTSTRATRRVAVPTPKKAPPGYLVVFDKPSAANHKVLQETLGLRVTGRTAGMTVFQAKAEAVEPPQLFEKLGVAAVDLTPTELGDMKAKVEARGATIFPNLQRHVMVHEKGMFHGIGEGGQSVKVGSPGRGLPFASPSTRPRPFHGGSGRPLPFAVPGGVDLAYLRGRRDALESLIGIEPSPGMRAAPGAPAAAPIAPASSSHSWCLSAIGVDPAYQRATGDGIKVAVLDTGIDLLHPDFAGRVVKGDSTDPKATAVSFVTGETVQDGHGHGTHCAGVVGGPANPAQGPRYGVAPSCDLMVGKVLGDDGGGYDSWILNGITWAIEHGARVVSMSLGSDRSPYDPYSAVYERVARSLLQDYECLLVAAAGNASYRPYYTMPVGNPAACPAFLAVAAVDELQQIAEFSSQQMDNIGLVDVAAPGVEVWSSVPGGYATMSGTSMATPHVAGVATLYLSVNANWNAYKLWWTLEQNARPLGNSAEFGRGLVQAP